MSLDYSPSPTSQQHLYGQQDLDSTFSSVHNGESVANSPTQHQLSSTLPPFNNSEQSDGGSSFASQRYRTNASSSSSLGPNFGESIYSHGPFADSVSSFNNGNSHSFDLVNGISSSSYSSSGKVSPLTPSEPVGGLPPLSAFPSSAGLSASGKEYPHHSFSEIVPGRRLSSVNASAYPSEFQDEFAMGNAPNGLPFPPVSQFADRLGGGRFQSDSRFGHASGPPTTVPSHGPHNQSSSDLLRGVAPHATHSYRPEGGVPVYDDLPHWNQHSDLSLRMLSVDETLPRMKLQPHAIMGSSNDLQTFIRPFLDQYVRTPNRLAFGERSIIVMSSKVAQKSYGTEKRFLCPPPTAIMIGNSWWTDVVRRNEDPKLCPPRVLVSISGESTPQEGTVEWTGATGKSFDLSEPPTGTTYIGRCVGKQLFISDVDEKKKKVEALVRVTAPGSDDGPERIIGTFPSRPIKVISKPSKKRQSAKNLELCINHGSTVSLFHRLRSQTVSTKYLCVSGSGSSFKGSDGATLMGVDIRRLTNPSFIARTASWDPFVMYIVDVNKPTGTPDAPPPPPPPAPHADYPSPPPNAISFTNNGSPIPVYYNQTVVLQCLTSGVVSPVLVIRKVDHQTTVVGGGLQEGAKGVADHYCAPGEVCGDPVSQLHKIAFEVHDSAKTLPAPGTPGATGTFLSCMGEKVNTYRPIEGRQWTNPQGPGSISPGLPGSPIATPTSAGPNSDLFGQAGDSAPASPASATDPMSNDGGRVKRSKRSTSSSGGLAKSVPKGRRRPTSAGSATSSRRGSSSDVGGASGALWQCDIGETSVWTIVGTEQVRYNFYVPPQLFDNQSSPTGSFPIPSKPVTPFPSVVKYLPPDRAAEAPKPAGLSSRAVLAKPNPHATKMLTLYGENFSKHDPIKVFFGSEPSPYVEVRCTEVLGTLPPEGPVTKRRPIILIRSDGVVFPTSTMYP